MLYSIHHGRPLRGLGARAVQVLRRNRTMASSSELAASIWLTNDNVYTQAHKTINQASTLQTNRVHSWQLQGKIINNVQCVEMRRREHPCGKQKHPVHPWNGKNCIQAHFEITTVVPHSKCLRMCEENTRFSLDFFSLHFSCRAATHPPHCGALRVKPWAGRCRHGAARTTETIKQQKWVRRGELMKRDSRERGERVGRGLNSVNVGG